MRKSKKPIKNNTIERMWARPEMNVTFRSEIMPGRSKEERTFRIEKVNPNGRVTLRGFAGEFRETAFEAIIFGKEKKDS